MMCLEGRFNFENENLEINHKQNLSQSLFKSCLLTIKQLLMIHLLMFGLFQIRAYISEYNSFGLNMWLKVHHNLGQVRLHLQVLCKSYNAQALMLKFRPKWMMYGLT